MTATVTARPAERVRPWVAADGLLGLSHIGFTVVDLDRATDFWCTVMGFRPVIQDEGLCMVWQPSALLAIGLSTQAGSAVGPFDPDHVGLDHLALAVADVPTLRAWADRFAGLSVPHSPITETDAGHHLNLRAPDDIALELFVIRPEFAGAVLGMELGSRRAAAGTHR